MIMARIFFSDFLSNDIDRCNTTVNAYRNGDCEIVEGYVKTLLRCLKASMHRNRLTLMESILSTLKTAMPSRMAA